MSAALSCLRDAKQRAKACLDEAQAAIGQIETELSAKKAQVRASRDQINEIDAAITALGG